MCLRHLVDENFLDRVTIGDDVSIENDGRRGLAVKRGDRGTVGLERRVERLNELGGRYRKNGLLENDTINTSLVLESHTVCGHLRERVFTQGSHGAKLGHCVAAKTNQEGFSKAKRRQYG